MFVRQVVCVIYTGGAMDDDSAMQRSVHPPTAPAAERGESLLRAAGAVSRPGRIPESELERLRGLSVPAVLHGLGFERDPKDPAYNWKSQDRGMRISLERGNLQVWNDHEQQGALRQLDGRFGGAGAIDVVRYVLDLNFRDAARWLGSADVTAASALRPASVSRGDRSSPPAAHAVGEGKAESALPTLVPASLPQVRHYLTDVRAIPAAIVENAISDGRLFADKYRNAVFRLDDLKGDTTKPAVGYAVRGTWDRSDNAVKPFHGNRGEKGLFVTGDPAARTVVFVESAIDAMSYQAVRGNALVLATSGSAVDEPARVAARLASAGYKIVTGYDADASGDRLSKQLAENLERLNVSVARDRPPAPFKDWNKQLQAQHQALNQNLAERERIADVPDKVPVMVR